MGICGSSPKDDPSLDQQTATGTTTDTSHTAHTAGIQQGQGQTTSPIEQPKPTHTRDPSQVHITMTDAKAFQTPQTPKKSISEQPIEKPMPEENELNRLFEEFMEGKLFKPEARKTMRTIPSINKWKMLCQEGVAQTNVHDTPGHWAQVLRGKSVHRKDLASLRIVLRGQGKQWMTTFVEEGGLTSLLACLSKDNPGDGVIAETLHCLKAFMNNEYGLSVVISAATAVDQVALVLITGDDEMRIQVVDLLAVICWISDKGHRTVMEALRNPRFHRRFELFVKVLQQPQENIEIKTRFLTFINAIINAVNDLKERVAIRREFLDLNFMLALENLHVLVDKHRGDNYDRVAQLAAQMDLFEQVMSGDKRDTSMRDVDLSDPEAIFHVVKQNVVQDGFTAQFANTLHLLMTIPAEPEIGERIWNNVNYVVHKAIIKIDANGRRDDESAANLTYEELKFALEEKEKQDAIDSVGRTKQLNDQVEHQRQHIHELTMKTTALEEQINALRAGGAVPAAPGSYSAPAAPPMAPDMGGGAPAAPPMAPDMGAPAAPPMAPDMNAPAAPPMAPGAPGAPPMAPGAPGAPPMAPGGIWGAAAAGAPISTLPKKKNNKPAQQMRPFHWGVVNPIDVEKSIWKEWTDEKVKLDVAGLETGFSAAAFKNAPSEKLPGQASGGHSSSHKKETISIIDPKRAYAVNIALARFKMTHRAMRDALLAMDEKTLDEDKLSALLAVAPTQEEIDSVRDYDGDEDSLGQAEQFFRTIAAVPRVKTRIEVLLFKKRFEIVVSEIEASLALCENALRNIRGSKSLKTVFEYVLAIGNYLNGGTAKGGAYGFKLDTLNKLKNTRAADGKQTLLHFLTIQLAKQNARAWLEELKILPDAARVEYNGLQADINKTRGLMGKLKTELDQSDKSASDRFYSVMNQFYDIANRRTQKLGDRLKALDNEAVFIAEQFAESPDKFRMDDIISLFNTFYTDYREAELWLEKQREEAAIEAKRSAQKELRDRQLEEKKIRAVAGDPKANEGKLVDAIMDQLSSKDSRDIMQAIRLRRKQGSIANPSPKGMSEQGKITFGAQLKPLYSKK